MSNISDELIERNKESGSERVKDQAEREVSDEMFRESVEEYKIKLRQVKTNVVVRFYRAFIWAWKSIV
jgi:hypothetical protein